MPSADDQAGGFSAKVGSAGSIGSQACFFETQICCSGANRSGISSVPIVSPIMFAAARSENRVEPHSGQKPRRTPVPASNHRTGPVISTLSIGTATRA